MRNGIKLVDEIIENLFELEPEEIHMVRILKKTSNSPFIHCNI